MLRSSLDWSTRRGELLHCIRGVPYNRDLRHLLDNIDGMIKTLSILEVDARRTRNTGKVEDKLTEINKAINTLEGWVLIAQLMR